MTKRKMKDSAVAWIGQVPEGWKILNLLYVLRRRISDGPHETPVCIDEGIPFISVDSLNDTEDIDFSVVKKFISQKDFELFSQRSRIEVGDILFSKAATIGKTAIVKNLGFMVWSPLAIIKPDCEKSDTKYLYYGLNCEGLVNAARLAGSMNTQANVGMRELEKVKVPLPPLSEQRKIAAFLDGECGKIDVLRGKVEKQIAALEEYRKSVITEAVTKGIKRGRKMRSSGVEWMSEVPSGWEMIRIGYLYDAVNERGNDQLPILSVSISSGVSDKQLDDEELDRKVNRSEDKSTYKHVAVGDLTYNQMRAWQGAFGTVTVEGMVSPAYVVCRPKSELNTRFIEYVLRTNAAMREIKRRSTGIVDFRLRLYWPEFKTLKIPYPSADEQREIAAYLDKKCAAVDSMVAKCREELDRLAEYKKSLIYEYVTGKKEVA